MFCSEQYQLIDFGNGRRLERFGDVLLDRPAPAADRLRIAHPELWLQAHGRFDLSESPTTTQRGIWRTPSPIASRWTIAWRALRLELKLTEFGHVGLFPEQAPNWQWIEDQVRQSGPGIRVLNLFAYTGASTLAAGAAGAEVTHVDSARNVLAWARRNAELSGLADARIRWIAEDAVKFARRELRRGSRYDAVIMDPPSYGHGPHGEVWRLTKHLPVLLEMCGRLTEPNRRFILVSCHSPGYDARRLSGIVSESFNSGQTGQMTVADLALGTHEGRELPSGVAVRWTQ